MLLVAASVALLVAFVVLSIVLLVSARRDMVALCAAVKVERGFRLGAEAECARLGEELEVAESALSYATDECARLSARLRDELQCANYALDMVKVEAKERADEAEDKRISEAADHYGL